MTDTNAKTNTNTSTTSESVSNNSSLPTKRPASSDLIPNTDFNSNYEPSQKKTKISPSTHENPTATDSTLTTSQTSGERKETKTKSESSLSLNFVLQYSLGTHARSVSALKFSPDGKWLASAGTSLFLFVLSISLSLSLFSMFKNHLKE
jgi:hypothetical protein